MFPYPKPNRERLPRNSKAWKDRVKEIFERDGYQCQNCHKMLTKETLAPHHIKSVGAGGGDEPDNLISLCAVCHEGVHRGNIRLW